MKMMTGGSDRWMSGPPAPPSTSSSTPSDCWASFTSSHRALHRCSHASSSYARPSMASASSAAAKRDRFRSSARSENIEVPSRSDSSSPFSSGQSTSSTTSSSSSSGFFLGGGWKASSGSIDSGVSMSPKWQRSFPALSTATAPPVAVDEEESRGSSSQSDDEVFKDVKCWTLEDDERYWAAQQACSSRAPPSESTLALISRHICYYLSDEYLQRDKYLLRQVRCKKDGFISLKLITSFKNIKKLTGDCQVVRSAIVRKASSVIVSPDGLRVRRRASLPDDLKKPRELKTVLAIRLPSAYNSINAVVSLFGIFGEVDSVRLLDANREVPADLRNYATQVKDIGQSLCAVVNFRRSEGALKAVRVVKIHLRTNEDYIEETEKQEDESSITSSNYDLYRNILQDLPSLEDCRLALLGPRVRRTLYRQDKFVPSQLVPNSKENACEGCYDDAAEDKETVKRTVSLPQTSAPSPHPPPLPHRRTASVAQLVTSSSAPRGLQKLQRRRHSHVTRQPRGPDGSAGFLLPRSTVQNG